MGTWTLEFDAPAEFLTANVALKKHWRVKQAITKAWRERAFRAAQQAHLPKGLRRIRIDVVLRFPTRRSRDLPNYESALKPVVDGLGPQLVRNTKRGVEISVGYGLIPNDTPEYVDGPHLSFGEPLPRSPMPVPGRVLLTITDLSAEEATT